MYQARINVTLKKSVLDPQGKTVLHALESLGYKEARDLRVGKYFELTVDAADRGKAEERIREMCDRILINPVIEQYSYELDEVAGSK